MSGRLYVEPDARDRYLAECLGVIKLARVAPGCLDFALSADPIEPGRINVYEHWESQADLERFRGSGPDDDTSAQILDAQVAEHHIA
ncbi:antibiotic biosynthesis monooxygenase family protein [Microtetraspora sp. NBRC 13810]|uniref:putative quinol monooxygenase n=1 Tax=Microtetraspora sp. NBRC 13810 TaxID=3030990 RepID=UPI0025536204|nr:antibiotic biosynthesis monooxygenase family protein [Microtetraspora sp. NBRC 13810]